MSRYSTGKIYTLRSYQTDDIYIGSTIQELSARMSGHRRNYKRHLNNKCIHITSFDIIKYDDCYIELLELYPCNSKIELERREGYHIRNTDCVNKIIVGRTPKEYREDNKEKIAVKQKEYREDNKEKIAVKQKEYREDNKEKIAVKKKEYYEDNKEKIAVKKKEYYEDNKEKIIVKNKQPYTCEVCRSIIRTASKARHERTKKHINALKSVENYE